MKFTRLIPVAMATLLMAVACESPFGRFDAAAPEIAVPGEPAGSRAALAAMPDSETRDGQPAGALREAAGLIDPDEDVLDFLPPLAPVRAYDGTWFPHYLGYSSIEIYRIAGGVPGDEPEAAFDAGGRGSERLRLGDGEFFIVNWRPEPGRYRILVKVADVGIGFLDVAVPRDGARETDGRGRGPSRAIPIKIRVEESAELSARVMLAEGSSPAELACYLRDRFGYGAEDTVRLLAALGLSSVQAGAALKEAYGLAALPGAAALHEGGYGFGEAAIALRDVWTLTAAQAAETLKGIGAGAGEVLTAIAGAGMAGGAYAVTPKAMAAILRDAGFAPAETAGALLGPGGEPVGEAVQIFQATGYAAEVTASAFCAASPGLQASPFIACMASAYQWQDEDSALAMRILAEDFAKGAAEAAAIVVEALGAAGEWVMAGLKDVYDMAAEEAGKLLRDLQCGFESIAKGLKETYGYASEQAMATLRDLGESFEALFEALVDIFEDTPQVVAKSLKDYYDLRVGQIAAIVDAVCEFGLDDITDLLHDVGYSVSEVAEELTNNWGLAQEGVAVLLEQAGYAVADIRDWFVDFFGSIGDWFEDLFS